MEAKDLIGFIRDLGFPAAVALFVLWRLDNRLKELADRFYGMVEEEHKGHAAIVDAVKNLERTVLDRREPL